MKSSAIKEMELTIFVSVACIQCEQLTNSMILKAVSSTEVMALSPHKIMGTLKAGLLLRQDLMFIWPALRESPPELLWRLEQAKDIVVNHVFNTQEHTGRSFSGRYASRDATHAGGAGAPPAKATPGLDPSSSDASVLNSGG